MLNCEMTVVLEAGSPEKMVALVRAMADEMERRGNKLPIPSGRERKVNFPEGEINLVSAFGIGYGEKG